MKKLSAKVKLALWNTVLMILMASIVMGLIMYFSGNIIATSSKTLVIRVVDNNTKELEFDDGMLETDDIDFFKDSVHTLLYTENGERIAGNLPEEFLNEPQLRDKSLTETTIDQTLYYVYDRLVNIKNYHSPMWVRGVIAVDEVASATNSILRIAFFSMPIFILLGGIGCYFIAKHTFSPIDKIVKTAKEISDNENLSLRIDLKGGSDEIQKLADTFDNMLNHLERAFESEKQFSSDVSHELRTPTAVILAQCEYALDSNATPKDNNEAFETVQRQALKMSRLISKLLSLTRLDRGIEKAEFKQVDFSELLTIICEEQQIIVPKGTTLSYSIEPNISAHLDYTMITVLITNLINNAYRYGKENGNVHISLTKNEEKIILQVKDDGIGISKENQSRIWQRFYQVNTSRTAQKDGSVGLGLSMVEQIAKLHHAKISVESEINKGSIFNITF